MISKFMPKFKTYNQSQSMLLPPNLQDCLPDDHICFIISDIVDELNISSIENTYSDNGCPAYDPRMLIKIMFYSYIQGIRSSRKIERLTYENIAHRYLAANQSPDHGTISLFRKDHLISLRDIFTQIVALCDNLGMIDPTDISIDGSIFKASASKKETYSPEDIVKARQRIQNMLQQAEELDKQEDKSFDVAQDKEEQDNDDKGGNQDGSGLTAKLKDPKTRQAAISKLQKKLQGLEWAEGSIKEKQKVHASSPDKKLIRNTTSNTADPDANLLKLKGGKIYKPAYKGQIATNNQIIVAYDITVSGSDNNSLLPMIEKTENNTGKKVKKVKADSVYFGKDNMKGVNEKDIDAYIPDQQKSLEERQERNKTVPKYDRRNFKYDKDKDEFICPRNQRLPLKGKHKSCKIYFCSNCNNCPVKNECTKANNRQVNIDRELEEIKSKMRTKLNTEKGKAKYLERMSDVEPVFGNIIFNQKADAFLCRGKPKVKIEFGLSCIAHNLVKVSNWIKKNKKIIKKTQLEALMRLPATV